MITIKNEIRIDKSKDQVFAFLYDFRNVPKWNYYIKEVVPIIPNNDNLAFRQIRKNDEQEIEVLESKFAEKIVIKTLPNSNVKFEREFNIETLRKDRCVIHDHFKLDTGHPGLFQVLFKNLIKKAVMQNLQKLKELLETGKTVLQDGRIQTI